MTPPAYQQVSTRTTSAALRRSTTTAAAVVLALLSGSGFCSAAAASPIPSHGQPIITQFSPEPTPSLAAAQLAAQTGEPVIVEQETTETSQTTANPDGTFTLVSNTQPVRVQQDKAWVPVDPTLEVRPDGTIGPKASTLDVTFSSGGNGPFATLTEDDDTLALSWPAELPTPVLAGNTATYPNILPGVDLQLTATESAYQQTLIVKNAVAAANPDLRTLELGVTADGVTFVDDGSGGLDAVNSDGERVFDGHEPVMWDSGSDHRVGADPTATNPGGAETSTMEQAITPDTGATTDGLAESTLTLTPPTEALTGTDVDYPVYIDPAFSVTTPLDWGFVFSNGWKSINNPAYDLKVGKCIDLVECNGINTGRAYFGFDAYPLTNRGVPAILSSVKVRVTQIHGYAACTPQPVDLHVSNERFNAGTVWPGGAYGSPMDQKSSAVGDTCPGAGVARTEFSSPLLTGQVQGILNSGNRFLDFALKSPDENNGNQWKRFASTGANAAPEIEINYGFQPTNIIAFDPVNSFNCGTNKYVTTKDVTVTGRATNSNPEPVNTELFFDLFQDGSTTTYRQSPAGLVVQSGVPLPYTFTNLPDGTYQYQVRARTTLEDGGIWAVPSPKVTFTVQTTLPTTAPTIVSEHFPADFWGAPQGTGFLYLGSGGATNVAGYAYGWDSAANIAAPTTADCNNYTKINGTTGGWLSNSGAINALTPPASLPVGPHTLYVRSFTAAHQMSAVTTAYKFYISPKYPNIGHLYEAETMTGVTKTNFPPAPVVAANSRMYLSSHPSASNGVVTRLLADGQSMQTTPAPDLTKVGPEFSWTFNAGIEADYAFGASLLKQNHFGKLNFYIEGPGTKKTPLIDPNTGAPYLFDGYSNTTTRVFQELGGLHLTQGTYKFTIKVVGKNTASINYLDTANGATSINDRGFSAALDYLIAVPINNATAASFTAAMNNNGIALNGTTANIGPSNSNTSISANALKAMNGYTTATSKFTTGGVTFGMPTSYDGNDNVIALGQTIPIPGGTTLAPTVEILAAAACNAIIKRETVLAFTIKYQSTSVDPVNPNLPTTPDFGLAAPTATVLDSYKAAGGPPGVFNTIAVAGTMPYRNSNGSQTTGGAVLYRITLHNPFPNEPITSITLPNIGTNLTNDCSPSLHIFSIADPTP